MTIEQIITQSAIYCDAAIEIADARIKATEGFLSIDSTSWFPETEGTIYVGYSYSFKNSNGYIIPTAHTFAITADEIETHLAKHEARHSNDGA